MPQPGSEYLESKGYKRQGRRDALENLERMSESGNSQKLPRVEKAEKYAHKIRKQMVADGETPRKSEPSSQQKAAAEMNPYTTAVGTAASMVLGRGVGRGAKTAKSASKASTPVKKAEKVVEKKTAIPKATTKQGVKVVRKPGAERPEMSTFDRTSQPKAVPRGKRATSKAHREAQAKAIKDKQEVQLQKKHTEAKRQHQKQRLAEGKRATTQAQRDDQKRKLMVKEKDRIANQSRQQQAAERSARQKKFEQRKDVTKKINRNR